MSFSASFSGFLAAPPETRTTENGHTLTRFRVGISDKFRDATGTFVELPTIWVNCQAWRAAAEAIRDANFPTGAAVVVIGQWRQTEWVDQNGEKRSTRFVEVEHIGPDLTVRRKNQPAAAPAAPETEDEVNPL